MTLLWRDPWLKPLSEFDVGTERCRKCGIKFLEIEFVTSCDFCEIGVMHDKCANEHILKKHKVKLQSKIDSHKDKPLHDYQ